MSKVTRLTVVAVAVAGIAAPLAQAEAMGPNPWVSTGARPNPYKLTDAMRPKPWKDSGARPGDAMRPSPWKCISRPWIGLRAAPWLSTGIGY